MFSGKKYLRGPKVRVKNVKGIIFRLWSYLSVVKGSFITAVFLLMVTTGLQILTPYFQGVAIDEGILAGNKEKLLSSLILMGILYTITAVMVLLENLIMISVSQKVVRNLRYNLFEKLQTLSLRFFDRNPHGELMSRVSNDIDLISQTLTSSLTQLISSALTVISVAILMIFLNLSLAVITLVSIPLIVLITKFIAVYTRKGYKQQQQFLGEMNGHIEESVSALSVVKLFGTEQENLKKFSSLNRKLKQASVKANIYGGIMGPFMNLMRNINLIIVAFAGGYLSYKGYISIGLIAVFLQYTRLFSRPLNEIAQLYNSLQSALAGAERVFAIMDEEPEITNCKNPLILEKVQGHVSFKEVNFAYVNDQMVLRDLSFEANPGDTVAIVGETGAGKTTIVNLLTRFYDIHSGSIEIDGVNIRDLEINHLRKNLGFVLQDTFLFSDSVLENIRYGKPDATEEEVIEAASLANAHHFIRQLPSGYHTVLSTEGNNLSEGQKQLLAIARVILSNPSILILDEATSSVDTRTEAHIQDALLTLMKDRTSFVIAHRLNTIRDAQMILVLDNGRIVEKGNHEELLAANGVYKNLYDYIK
jgi:ATP-binding cassette subfamily B protein